MEEADRRVIQLYLTTLSSETNFNLLWSEMLARDRNNIITPLMKENYLKLQENNTSNCDLNKTFYSDIQTRGKEAFPTLLKCLREVHPQLAKLLFPLESDPVPIEEESSEESDNESNVYRGYCCVAGDHDEKIKAFKEIKKLCNTIHAKLIYHRDNAVWSCETKFELLINLMGITTESAIQEMKAGHEKNSHLKIKVIIINITSEQMKEGDLLQSAEKNESSSNDRADIFVVSIYIHPGDHVGSVLRIIRKVIAEDPRLEIRDIFHVVTDKLAKWGCRLNTESRSFPRFSFDS